MIPDIHMGMEDEQACEVALAIRRAIKPSWAVQIGDALDLGALSSHPRKSFAEKYASIENENRKWREFARRLRGRKGLHLTWILGNHEHRLERFLLRNAPQLEKLVTIEQLAGDIADKLVPYVAGAGLKEYHKVGDMLFVHGWSHSRYATSKHLEHACGRSIAHGHTHRSAHVVVRDVIENRTIHGVCPGTLCQLQPIYRNSQPTTWTHGVTVMYEKRGHVTPFNITIESDGTAVLPSGKLVRA
ncbi:MAG: hypothetical protein ACPG4T_12380 [Nannocystaceae bacterium]